MLMNFIPSNKVLFILKMIKLQIKTTLCLCATRVVLNLISIDFILFTILLSILLFPLCVHVKHFYFYQNENYLNRNDFQLYVIYNLQFFIFLFCEVGNKNNKHWKGKSVHKLIRFDFLVGATQLKHISFTCTKLIY